MNLTSFFKIFGWQELKSIGGGRYWRNIGWLSLIYFPALLAIGLGNGTISHLRKIMDNPFVKFVPVEIPWGRGISVSDLKRELEKPEVQTRFRIDQIQYSGRAYAEFRRSSSYISASIRSLSGDDPFLEFLDATPDIVVSANPNFATFNKRNWIENWGCIVTEGFMHELYPDLSTNDWPPYILHFNNIDSSDVIPIPVSAVVTELPNFCDLMVEDKLLQAIKGAYNSWDDSPFNLSDHNDYLIVFANNPSSGLSSRLKADGFSERTNSTHKEGSVLEGRGLSNPNLYFDMLKRDFPRDSLWRLYDFSKTGGTPNPVNKEDITIAFAQLDMVKSFQQYLLGINRHLKVDMNVIKAKENFSLFEKLTNALSYGLTFFGVLSAFLFVVNLITSHLEKNRKSIGTLKAFGLTNNSIVGLYTLIACILLIAVLVISYLVFTLVGPPCLGFILNLWGIMDTGHASDFHLYGLPVMVLLFVVLPVSLIASQLFFRIRNTSPGDLIYERSST